MARREPLTLRPYALGDVWRFEPRADFVAEREVSAALFEGQTLGFAWTVMRGDQIVGVAGALEIDAGVWSVAALLSALPRPAWPQALALAGQTLAMLHRERGAAKVWASWNREFAAAQRTLHRLGFADYTVICATTAAWTHHHMLKVF